MTKGLTTRVRVNSEYIFILEGTIPLKKGHKLKLL